MSILPTNCRWLIAGDFNFVEFRQNKTISCSRLVPMRERLVFGALKLFLDVDKPSRSTDNQRFFWNNFRSNGRCVLARLDECYIFPNSATTTQSIISYKIRSNTGWSNHLLIECSFQLEVGRSRPSRWHMNSLYLEDTLPQLVTLWNQ